MLLVLEGTTMTLYSDPIADLFCYGDPDAEVGTQEFGQRWYGRYDGPISVQDMLEMCGGDREMIELMDADMLVRLGMCAGVIATADHDGNRRYAGYDDAATFEQAWRDAKLDANSRDSEALAEAIAEDSDEDDADPDES